MKNIRLGVSAISERVHAGRVSKVGDTWLDKCDVHNDFLSCVIDFFDGKETTITSQSGEKWEVVVRKLEEES